MALFLLAHARTCAARILDRCAHTAHSQSTASVGPGSTALGSFHGCNPSTSCPGDHCTPHPCVVAACHLIHTRPPDIHVACLAYPRSLSNIYFSLGLRRPRSRNSERQTAKSQASDPTVFSLLPAVESASTFRVLAAVAATCLTARMTLRMPAVISAAVHAALLIVMMKIVIVLVANLTSHLTMPHLNAAVSSHMKTFPAISTASSWSSASSFAGF
jgi:hypothetical protein